MGQAWFYTQGNQQAGPVEWGQLQQLAASGHLNPADLVWTEGMAQWTAASTMQGLMPGAPAAAQAPYPANPGGLNYYSAGAIQQFAYGGFWLRFVAYIIDGIVTSIGNFAIGLVVGFAIARGGGRIDPAAQLALNAIGIVTVWLYFSLMESSAQQATLGKMALGLKVVDLNGARISFGKATGRYFAKILSALILCIGFIMIGFTERKQGLHDQLAGTLVTKQ